MSETSPPQGPSLPDGTTAANAGATGGNAPSAADLVRGYLIVNAERTSPFDVDDSGGENAVGDPFNYGGVLGRPRGFAR